MMFQVFNPRQVTEVQSACRNHIEAAPRNIHMRAPNLQLVMVIFSRCFWSLWYVHPSIPKFVKKESKCMLVWKIMMIWKIMFKCGIL